ncbi:MAG: CotH kinase family protein [Clostridia bacterium]|nr:CotH kinase family protein [Clostridia bacterium]
MKKLSNGEDLDNTVDIDAVIRYFVVHNFVMNFDSYTGSMIHNYYLYESNGQMQMIPWDYNLAFGGFSSAGGAANLINYPIDSPVSGGNAEDRPMIAWIFNNEEYTELYHKYFSQFISEYFDSGYFEKMIDEVASLIAPYVEKDPTKFCTYEEFETGAATLKEFCLLRAKSISGQLDGTIGSTTETQKSDTLIDAGNIQISAMGSMRNTMGGGMNRPGNNMQSSQNNGDTSVQTPPSENNADNSGSQAQPSTGDSAAAQSDENGNNSILQAPDGKFQQKNVGQSNPQPQTAVSPTSLIMLAISIAVLVLGTIFAFVYKRRK